MYNILKMYYGIDQDINGPGYFKYQGQLYYFCPIDHIQTFLDVYRTYRYLMHLCGLEGYSLVKNHNQDIISQSHVLLLYHPHPFSFPNYLQAFLQPLPYQKIKIKDIKEQWICKIDCVRERVKDYAYSFKHDQDVISLIYYYCGVGENSINILNEILAIDPEATLFLSLSLKHPIPNYVYELLNPTYYTLSTRPREIVCLLRSQLLSYDQIQDLLETQYYDVYEIIYLYARVLYPATFFDQVLSQQMDLQTIQNNYFHIDEERKMYQEMMNILSFYVRLPKISWINDENMV